jgi:ELWxxDGT repeat protein
MFLRCRLMPAALVLAASLGCSPGLDPSDAPVESQRSAVGLPPEECSGPAYLVKRIFEPEPGERGGPRPYDLTAAGGKLFFRARGSLWVSNGREDGTFPFRDEVAMRPLDVNGRVFFFEQERLYRTDGTPAGTVLVEDLLLPGFTFNGKQFTGNGLYYFVSTGDSGSEGLFRSNGTPEGTHLVASFQLIDDTAAVLRGHTYFMAQREPAEPTRMMLWRTDGNDVELVSDLGGARRADYLTRVGSTLFFLATGPVGLALWKSDGTTAGTVEVRGFGTDALFPFVDTPREVDGRLLFSVHRRGNVELWASDGTTSGTVLLREFLLPSPAPSMREMLIVSPEVLGGRVYLFFVLDQAGGPAPVSMQLWRSDGTPEGTFALTHAIPGEEGGVPTIAAVNGLAVFGWREASDTPAESRRGKEPWITDGTVAGTGPLQDLRPGALGSWPDAFTLAGGRVYFVARTDTIGFSLWAIPVACLRGHRGPPPPPAPEPPPPPPAAIHCPADMTVEATGPEGARVELPAAMAAGGSPSVYSRPSGSVFPLGTTQVIVQGTDAVGQRASCAFNVTVRDSTAPLLFCPPNQWIYTWSREGTAVDYPRVGVLDLVSDPEVRYSVESGDAFSTGATEIVATATDDAGNEGACSFRVTVQPMGCSAAPGNPPWWMVVVFVPLLLILRACRKEALKSSEPPPPSPPGARMAGRAGASRAARGSSRDGFAEARRASGRERVGRPVAPARTAAR